MISILLCWLYLRAVWHASWAAVWQADPLTQTHPWLSSELLVRFTAAKIWPELSAQRWNHSSQVSIHAPEEHPADKYLNSFLFFLYNHTCSHRYFKKDLRAGRPFCIHTANFEFRKLKLVFLEKIPNTTYGRLLRIEGAEECCHVSFYLFLTVSVM